MIRLLKRMPAKDWGFFAIVCVLIFVSAWMTFTMPGYMSQITTLVETEGSEMSEIWYNGLMMLLCACIDVVATVTAQFFASKIAASFAMKIRSDLYNKVVDFSMEEINEFSTASLVTRTTNDITQIQLMLATGTTSIVRVPVMVIWAFIKIVGFGWQFSVISVCTVVFMLILVATNLILVIPKFRRVQIITDKINSSARENLTGVRVVRAYNAEKYQEDKFDEPNKDITKTQIFTGKVMGYLFPGMQFAMNGTSLATYLVGSFVLLATGTAAGRITVFSNMVVFMTYAVHLVMSFMVLAMIFSSLPRAQVSAARINEVLDKTAKILDGEGKPEEEAKGTVEFRNVSFKYPDAEESVLENITFRAEPGETVAFIGATGSGKSTLVNLIPRFYDVTEGQVLVDGVDVRDYKQSDLREKLGYVSQKAILFKGTIASNVAYGSSDEPDEARIRKAMEIAQGSDILDKDETGIKAPVAQGGTNFSGGQKQRISIARAVYRQPEIYIFDDSFSALDYKTDKKLRSVLAHETAGITTFIVAQRIGTVRDADKIIVIDEGKMVGIGTHEELLSGCEIYRQIALSQLSKEELA